MSDEQQTPEDAAPPKTAAPNKHEARQEMLRKVQKAREARMRHQNPQGDEEGPARRHDKGYAGRPAPAGNAKGGAPVRKKDAG